jgi:2-oxo-3-hexenedioate decarboxylase
MNDDAIVGEVLGALEIGRQIALITDRDAEFRLNDAYRIARRVCEARELRGETPIGRKIGFTNRMSWPQFHAHAPMWGYVYASTAFDLGPDSRAPLARVPEPRIEPEIVFGLAAAPEPDMDERALTECLAWVAHGFEIVQSIYNGWRCLAADAVVGFGMHASLWIGSRRGFAGRSAQWTGELAACRIDLYRDGELADRGDAANVLGGPLQALRALVQLLADDPLNPPLAAGEIVTTGSFTRALPIAPGQVWTTRISGVPLEGLRLPLTRE